MKRFLMPSPRRCSSRSFRPRPSPRSTSSPANPNGARWRRSWAATRSSVYIATNALAGPAPYRGQAQPDRRARAAPTCGLHRRGARDRLAAAVLRQSGNPKIQPGKPGYFEAAAFVPHAGNADAPRPRRRRRASARQSAHPDRSAQHRARGRRRWRSAWPRLDPANAAYYQARQRSFAERWKAAIARWEKQAAPLKGMPIVVQHKAFPYLEHWLGLKQVAALEPKPGVEPTSAHLSEVLAQLQRQPAKMVMRAAYNDDRASRVARRARQDPRRRAAVHRRRQRAGQGSVRPVRRHHAAPARRRCNEPRRPRLSASCCRRFVAGLLVLATHVPLGTQVLARGIVFIDLAIAQIAGLGVIAADALGFEPQGWAVQVAALAAALLGALLLTWTEKRWPDVQEALIGVLFVLAASAGMLLLANNPHGGEHLKDLLVGQILWVQLRAAAAGGAAQRADPRAVVRAARAPRAHRVLRCCSRSPSPRRCSWSACIWCSPP